MSDNDLISRQDAIEAIRKSTEKYNYFMGMENYTDEDAIEAVMSVPTILSVSNTGKCTKLNCPMQASVVPPDCNNQDCPFRTDNKIELHLLAEIAWQNYRKKEAFEKEAKELIMDRILIRKLIRNIFSKAVYLDTMMELADRKNPDSAIALSQEELREIVILLSQTEFLQDYLKEHGTLKK